MAKEGKMADLEGKTILLGVTGSIAAYKAPSILRKLMSLGAEVFVVMTRNATRFIAPLTFQALSGRPVLVDMFAPLTNWQIEHIALAERADLVLIAPATANVMGKIASGIADDLLTTTVMATKAPVVIAPAMNVDMYENPIVQDNIKKLEGLGYTFVEPGVGILATGVEGRGRLAEIEDITKTVVGLLKSDA
jgi:phosphopantothenoylcysteine decarboxylase/phosphopantothenate--cysteine ligase